MFLKDADGIANSVDPDQIAPLGAVWSGSALFAQAYLSENLWSLSYNFFGNPNFSGFKPDTHDEINLMKLISEIFISWHTVEHTAIQISWYSFLPVVFSG